MMGAYNKVELRALAATTAAATSGQDSSVTLERIRGQAVHVHIRKTAEANGDNLLTVRLQAKIGTEWVDCRPLSISSTQALATAAGTAEITNYGNGSAAANIREQNIIEASSLATFERTAYYDRIPSDEVRVAWIASGTAVSHTFEAWAAYAVE